MKKDNKKKLSKNLLNRKKLEDKRDEIDEKLDELKQEEEAIIAEEILVVYRAKNISLEEAIERLNRNQKEKI